MSVDGKSKTKNSRFKINSDWLAGIARVIATNIPVMTLFLFGNVTETSELGNLNYFIAIVFIANVFTNFGIPEAVQRFLPQANDKSSYIFQTVLFEMLIAFLGASVLVVVDIFTSGEFLRGFRWLVFLIVLSSASHTIILIYNGLLQKARVTLYFFGSTILYLLVFAALVVNSDKSATEIYLWSQLASWAAFTVIPLMDLYYNRLLKIRFYKLKRFVKFAMANAAVAIAVGIFIEADALIVFHFEGEFLTGIYKSVNYIALVPNVIATVLLTQLLPQYSSLHSQGRFQELNGYFLISTKRLLLAAPVVVILSWLFAEEIIGLVFNETIATEGAAMLPIILVGAMAYTALIPAFCVLLAFGRENIPRDLLIVVTTLYMGGTMIMFPIFGIYSMILWGVFLLVGVFVIILMKANQYIQIELNQIELRD